MRSAQQSPREQRGAVGGQGTTMSVPVESDDVFRPGANGNGHVNGYYGPPVNANGHSPTNSNGSGSGGRLSIIMENGDVKQKPPGRPARTAHRPVARRLFGAGADYPSPDHSPDGGPPPPPYSKFAAVMGTRDKKLQDVRNRKQIARRGGWKRLLILALVVIAIIVGLVVGLVVGLRNRKASKAAPIPPPATTSPAADTNNKPFPQGSYAITTFLSMAATNCTSNSAAWRCYPYTTYSESSTQSAATFNWIINPDKQSDGKYTISSTDNPFALVFDSVPLEIRDQGADSEHYTFSTPMDKSVIPSTALTSDGSSSVCQFNGTNLTAQLFTKQKHTYPPSTPSSNDANFKAYPYAVSISQTINGGDPDVPRCFKSDMGNPTGPQITDTVQSRDGQCSCEYKNYDAPQ